MSGGPPSSSAPEICAPGRMYGLSCATSADACDSAELLCMECGTVPRDTARAMSEENVEVARRFYAIGSEMYERIDAYREAQESGDFS
jgi:hypothetical protein